MRKFLRNYLINLVALFGTVQILPGLTYLGGLRGLFVSALGLMLINIVIVPLLKLMFLPLNLLTFGLFTWVINVLALYILTSVLPYLKLTSFYFEGTSINGFILPAMDLNILHVAILASFLVGFISHFLHWLLK